MRRPAPLRLTVVLSTATATAALGVLLAPTANADPDRDTLLPERARLKSNAPSVVSDVPPFGRKIS
jgi:hypothetical protein